MPPRHLFGGPSARRIVACPSPLSLFGRRPIAGHSLKSGVDANAALAQSAIRIPDLSSNLDLLSF
jgi:hypothetical protein